MWQLFHYIKPFKADPRNHVTQNLSWFLADYLGHNISFIVVIKKHMFLLPIWVMQSHGINWLLDNSILALDKVLRVENVGSQVTCDTCIHCSLECRLGKSMAYPLLGFYFLRNQVIYCFMSIVPLIWSIQNRCTSLRWYVSMAKNVLMVTIYTCRTNSRWTDYHLSELQLFLF